MSITKQAEDYILEHPSIRDSLIKGLVNYSALSRLICKELKIEQFDAVLIACRRYYWRTKHSGLHEKNILELVKNAKIRLRNKMMVAIIEKPRDFESIYSLQQIIKKKKGDFNIIEGEETITVITNSSNMDLIKEKFRNRIIKISDGLVQLSLIFDEKIELTSGVVSYVYSLLAEHGINILEEMSCWTDLMVIIDEKDMAKAVQSLA